MNRFDFLVAATVDGKEVVSCVCCNTNFSIRADCTQVYNHSRSDKHIKNRKGPELVAAERRQYYLERAVSICPQHLAISDSNTCGCGPNFLICTACYRYFDPKQYTDLCENARDHLRSDLHQREVKKREERQTRIENSQKLDSENAYFHTNFTATGLKRVLQSPEKYCQRKFCKRTIEEEDAKLAAQVAVECGSVNSVNTTSRGAVIAHTGRTVSPTTVWRLGIPSLAKGE